MSVLNLLDELEDILENGSSIPFSGKVLIDREEITELLKEIRIQLPDEVKQAQWIREERNKILIDAQSEAERIIEEAKRQVEELINQQEIIKLAQDKANEIVEQAKKQAHEIRVGSLQYADEILEKLEKNISDVSEIIRNNRMELKEMNI
ncbi:hypothetical protein SAMN02745883_00197 [Caminicella sporogenes DSM 14501]|uniref:ATPase n=1 Tax=Caminicella sporogenes DSM 14501 TaxID=1121266 RepID=A0A1M6LGC5_9FIRM|nr:ATPase [Caminicella sporogenes]RKD27824.1 ATPase [Caminicella sporogenes]WIF94601.1 ATPase [Caminicella sporogenes]SHJ70271.1 hypothetical protein SAMN02745883_00197 [Caminicella sporogenes DSM 14501]